MGPGRGKVSVHAIWTWHGRSVLFTCVASLYLLLCDIPVTPTTPTTTPTTTVRFLIKFRVSRCKIYKLEGTGSNQEKLPVFNFIR